MLVRSLWLYLTGYAIIKAKGPRLEAFINGAVQRGVPLWDLERPMHDVLVAKVGAGAFGQLRPLARKIPVRLTVIDKQGVPFLLSRMLRRRVLLAGAVASVLVLFALSSFVWFVRVEGAKNVPVETILGVAKDVGLKPGLLRHRLDRDTLERLLLIRIPSLAWAGIELRGTVVTIKVAERHPEGTVSRVPGDVVAARSGLVVRILPTEGRTMVSRGDSVRRGQLLISGEGTAPSGPLLGSPQGGVEGGTSRVRADGSVMARVFYEGYGEAPLSVSYDHRTGRTKRATVVKIGPWLYVRGKQDVAYPDYRARVEPRYLKIRGVRLPVEWARIDYYEVKPVSYPVDYVDARRRAVDGAKAQAKKWMLQDGNIIKEELKVWSGSGDKAGLVRARVVLEALENIAEFRPDAGRLKLTNTQQ